MTLKSQTLGKSPLVSTRLAHGCMRVSGTMERDRLTPALEAAGRQAILAAYEAGYTHFDHADIYGNGLCEEIFGRVLREVPGMRDRVLVGTRCGIRWKGDPDPSAPHRWDFSREHILRSCEGSLKRLGTDRIDLFMLHRPDPRAPALQGAAREVCEPGEAGGILNGVEAAKEKRPPRRERAVSWMRRGAPQTVPWDGSSGYR